MNKVLESIKLMKKHIKEQLSKDLIFDFYQDQEFDCYMVNKKHHDLQDIIVLPDYYNDGYNGKKPVKIIPEMGFYSCLELTSLIMPDTIEIIGSDAFNHCESLQYIKLSKNLEKISDNLFAGCSILTNVVIPKTVTEIGAHAFKGCKSLIDFTIPNSVLKIDKTAFEGCSEEVQAVYNEWRKNEVMRNFCMKDY